MVRQSALAGKRICFTDEVSHQDHHRDITDLLDATRQSAHVVGPLSPAQQHLTFITPALNQVNGIGWGHFANGLFFACPHPNERAFFWSGPSLLLPASHARLSGGRKSPVLLTELA
ncbi:MULTISPECIES: hypothetical protein [Spirosoma]|uniref:Uncharacterized protein n=1 Tax=Spirosoma liriopis TaxID=2937440 RepID=A0ABT0HTK8_9BACT|nr:MULTISPECIES: hypothetical protein [Spirosoma]MCK8495496.1 hypothetical protein [Spirosoma liriopis]UHG94508.1 hypothetical protein LQ777_28380 [Spirosoma oryzicola]